MNDKPTDLRGLLDNASLGRRPTDVEVTRVIGSNPNREAIVAACQEAAMEFNYGRTAVARTIANDAYVAYS